MDLSSKRHHELSRSLSHKNNVGTPSSKSALRRSHSVKNSSAPSSSATSSSSLPRSSSLRAPSSSSSSSSSKFNADNHLQSEKGSGNIARKYSSLAKEQKARFYIIRRCVAMLVCWHKHGD